MNKRSIREALWAKLSPLAKEGFRLKRNAMVRSLTPGTTEKVFCDVLDYRPKYILEPALAVRIDKVEEIFHRTSVYEKKYHSETPTISFAFGHVNPDLDLFRYDVTDAYSLESALNNILRDFQTYALPFLQANTSIEALDRLLNDAPKEDCSYCRMEDLRCSHGLIVAKLTKRSNYDELKETYFTRLRSFADGFYLPSFERLAVDLDSRAAAKDTGTQC